MPIQKYYKKALPVDAIWKFLKFSYYLSWKYGEDHSILKQQIRHLRKVPCLSEQTFVMQNGKLQALETVMGNRIFVLDCELGIAEVWWVDKGEVVARWDVCSEFPFSRKESSITKSYSGSQTQMMTFPRVLTCYTGRKEIHEEREGSERQPSWEGWKFPTLAECDQLQAANFSWHLQWSPLLSPLLILHRYTTYFCLWSPGTAHKDIYIKRGEERKEPAWVSFWDTQCYWSHWSEIQHSTEVSGNDLSLGTHCNCKHAALYCI